MFALLAAGPAAGAQAAAGPAQVTDWLPLRDGVRWVYDLTSTVEIHVGNAAPKRDVLRTIRVDGIERMGPSRYKWGVYREINQHDGADITDTQLYQGLVLVSKDRDLLEVARYWDGGTAFIAEPEEAFPEPLIRLRAGPVGTRWPYVREEDGFREELTGEIVGVESVDTPAGRFEDCVVVRFAGKASGRGQAAGTPTQWQPSERGWTEWWAPGVGKVKKVGHRDLRGRTNAGQPARLQQEATLVLREYWLEPPAHPAPPPSKDSSKDFLHTRAREIYALLEAGRFPEVDARFRAILADYRSGRWTSQDLEHLIGHVAKRAELSAWLAARPDSWAAHLARGKALVREGWSRRGAGFVRDSTGRQLDGMRASFEAAVRELVRAVELEPTVPTSFSLLLEIARSMGSPDESRKIFERLLEAETDPVRAYEEYMWSLEPRWGGSFEAMSALAAEALRRHGREVGDAVKAKYLATLGNLAWHHKHRDDAEKLYGRALELVTSDAVLQARGRLRASMGRFKAALADFDLLFERSGQRMDVVVARADMRRKLGWYDQARADLAYVIAQWPDDTNALIALAEVEVRQRQFDSAAARWERITELRGDRVSAWSKRGDFLARRLGRHADAARAYARAVEMAEADPSLWYRYGMELHYSGSRDSALVLTRFLQLAGTRSDYRKEVAEVRAILTVPAAARER